MTPSLKSTFAAALDRKNATQSRKAKHQVRDLAPTSARGGQYRPTHAPRRQAY
ncbi:hypothetical protein [Streptomyces sp. NPDC002994]|uniref:hypothetical protein n=1 Tax=Streptomyces sp. NPDC002994 TaxID=3154441 RepID=UPI0033B5077D